MASQGPAPSASRRHARSRSANWAAFILGLPLGFGILAFLHYGPVDESIQRYVSHKVEWVEVMMFSCAMAALLTKMAGQIGERGAFNSSLLPAWTGALASISEATNLLAGVSRLSRGLQNTLLVRRVSAVLDFLCRRGSAAELDDQLRALSDTDALAQENSYSLIRFITWAIPILGFLGTVLGITKAISGVNPEVLEHDLSSVTDGLAFAFNATALALALTMVIMFFTFLTERVEQGTLESIETYIDHNLAHRFQRAPNESGAILEILKHNTAALVQSTESLVKRQAELWSMALEKADARQAEGVKVNQDRFTRAIEDALTKTQETFLGRLATMEKKSLESSGPLVEKLATLSKSLGEQQSASRALADGLDRQTQELVRLQDNENHLLHLQATLSQNLDLLASTGAFEQAIHSLTAAIHLLTARSAQPPSLALPPKRPGAAA